MAAPRPRARSSRRPPRLPLEGFRVVELAHHLAAPLASMYLGDFGADIVKVESLEGEDWRRWGRPSRAGMSQLFISVNRNKRSLSVDLTTPAGRGVLDRLLGRADVLVTNWAPGVLRELGLHGPALARRYPRLVACALSAFGARGPHAGRRAFDMVVAGEAGLLLPHPDGVSPPLVNPAPIADTAGAMLLAYGVVLALLQRERGGRAQSVETALLSVGVALQAHRFIWLDGDEAPDMRPPRTVVYRPWETKDGFVTVGVVAERLWRRLCKALGLERLLADPRYMPWSRLLEHQGELREVMEERFRTRTTDEWVAVLSEAGVPAGRVQWGAPVFDHPQLAANRVVLHTRHPRAGALRMMGFPLRLGTTPARLRRHAPALGADSRAVLRDLGYRPAEITGLLRAGVVGAR